MKKTIIFSHGIIGFIFIILISFSSVGHAAVPNDLIGLLGVLGWR